MHKFFMHILMFFNAIFQNDVDGHTVMVPVLKAVFRACFPLHDSYGSLCSRTSEVLMTHISLSDLHTRIAAPTRPFYLSDTERNKPRAH